jgi:hypothetical protein
MWRNIHAMPEIARTFVFGLFCRATRRNFLTNENRKGRNEKKNKGDILWDVASGRRVILLITSTGSFFGRIQTIET